MKEYDVFIAGGGIAGSIAAKFAAKNVIYRKKENSEAESLFRNSIRLF